MKESNRIFTFPDKEFKMPSKYNEEWLEKASMEEKIEFLNEFMNGFRTDSINVREQTKINELNIDEL